MKSLVLRSSIYEGTLRIIDTKTLKTLFYTELSKWEVHQNQLIASVGYEITVQIQSKFYTRIDAELYIFDRPGKWYY